MASSAMASSDNVLRKDRTKQLISTFINPELSSVEQEQAIVELASVKQLLIPDLIEHIGEELTSLDDKIRNRATLLLAELLHR